MSLSQTPATFKGTMSTQTTAVSNAYTPIDTPILDKTYMAYRGCVFFPALRDNEFDESLRPDVQPVEAYILSFVHHLIADKVQLELFDGCKFTPTCAYFVEGHYEDLNYVIQTEMTIDHLTTDVIMFHMNKNNGTEENTEKDEDKNVNKDENEEEGAGPLDKFSTINMDWNGKKVRITSILTNIDADCKKMQAMLYFAIYNDKGEINHDIPARPLKYLWYKRFADVTIMDAMLQAKAVIPANRWINEISEIPAALAKDSK